MTLPQTNDDRMIEAAQWCLRVAEGGLSPEEEEVFGRWLEAGPENREAFHAASGSWEILDACASEPEMIAIRGAALETARRAYVARGARRRIVPDLRHLALAASVAVIILVTGLWLSMRPETYSTNIGERKQVALVDGSRLSLDADTNVEVSFTDGRRRISLKKGRAKFDVAKDPLRPFTVEAGGRTVVATGTSFSVEIAARQVRVVLFEGKVSVLATEGESRLGGPTKPVPVASLDPGQELVFASASTQPAVTVVDTERERSWEEGRLDFHEEPLGLAAERLNRYSAAHRLKVEPGIAQVRISGVFNTGDTRAFAEGVTAILPIDAERTDDGAILLKERRPR